MSDLPDSIASRITVDPISGCWKVAGNLDKNGYARIAGEGAHRVVYKLLVGPIPEGLVLDHVVKRVNTLRGNSPHAINARKDCCDNGHTFDLINTYWFIDKDGHERRDCRPCIRERVRKYKELHPEAVKATRRRCREQERLTEITEIRRAA